MVRKNTCEGLSMDERDYLVRNNGDKVKIASLNGKYVVLYFMHFPTHRDDLHPLCLVEAYKNPKGDFELVFVAFTKDVDENSLKYFNKYFSKMPCLPIPFYDLEARKQVYDALSLPLPSRGNCMVINAFGRILHDCALEEFEEHGADWYPFTSTREGDIYEEELTAMKSRSLIYFLSSHSLDYVLTKHGDRNKVPIAEHERKPVGLYFYDGKENVTEILVGIYNKLKTNDKNFEIVFMNLYGQGGYTDEESFKQGINKMPWLTMPFGETKGAQLSRMFNIYREEDTALLVVKSGEFYESHAMRIIKDYGIEAYPFTREKAAKIEIERERHSLFFLFDKGDQKFVIQNDRDKTKIIKVSELKDRTIVILFASILDVGCLSNLIRWYEEMKRVDDGFEIIYVSGGESRADFDEMFKQMPWLESKIGEMLLFASMNTLLLGFGVDGKLIAKTVIDDPEDWNLLTKDSYPFGVRHCIVDHVIKELEYDHLWITLD